jgi:hypothetical protein
MTLPLTSPIAAQRVPFLSRYAVEDISNASSTACGRGKGPIACDGIGEGESIRRFSPKPSFLRRQGSSFFAAIQTR